MVLHNTLKSAKIAEDIFVYFLEKGCKEVSISIKNQEFLTLFKITLFEKNEELIKTFKQHLYCSRDLTVEEYGWDVVIENDGELELEHLGYQLDSCDVIENDNGYVIELIRRKC